MGQSSPVPCTIERCEANFIVLASSQAPTMTHIFEPEIEGLGLLALFPVSGKTTIGKAIKN